MPGAWHGTQAWDINDSIVSLTSSFLATATKDKQNDVAELLLLCLYFALITFPSFCLLLPCSNNNLVRHATNASVSCTFTKDSDPAGVHLSKGIACHL